MNLTAKFEPLPPPHRLFVPLSPRKPGEAVACKPAGTRVACGEPLGEAATASAFVPLSPIAGRIITSTRVDLLNGHRVAGIELEVDDTAGSTPLPPPEPTARGLATLADWIDALRTAGVWAERRGSPDLIAQLHQAVRRPCDTVVCQVLDDDSRSGGNEAVAGAFPAEVVAAVSLLATRTSAERAQIVLDVDAPAELFARLRAAANGTAVKIIGIRSAYPQSDPTLLVYALRKRRLRPGRLPTEQGVVQLDAAAAAAVGAVALRGQPMLSVPLTVTDAGAGTVHRQSVAIGTPLRHILQRLGIDSGGQIRVGDSKREQRASPDAVVSGGELLIHGNVQLPARQSPDPCIRCGWCVQACPTRIHPAGILEAAQENDTVLADRYGLESCIECGICSYVCPSRLPLLGAIRSLRRSKPAVARGPA
jgi:electron transport complex protein RnfC